MKVVKGEVKEGNHREKEGKFEGKKKKRQDGNIRDHTGRENTGRDRKIQEVMGPYRMENMG